MKQQESHDAHAVLYLSALTVILWSTAFVFTRIAIRSISPFPLGLLRYGAAALVLVGIGFAKHIGLPSRRDIPLFLLLGALGFFFYQLFFNIAMTTISAATASVVVATVPVLTAFFASLLFHERLGKVGWIAVIIEFGGILVLTLWHREVSLGWGLFWMLAAAICFAVYNLIQRFSKSRYSSLQATIYSITASALMFLIFLPQAVTEVQGAPLSAVLAVVFMGVFPSAIGFLLWNKALSLARQIGDVTNFMFVTPLLSTLLGVLLIQELPDSPTILGGVLILFGFALFNNRSKLHRPANKKNPMQS
ncbi:MAG: DMT family transporter [Sphaerochaeta sp.]|jgi:drug/metabolite transporter (DMT)-like permease|uniref:DMT family transporter n=1 Tax=Sphaerochaeta sp. TaxID=1972642 RepID=UPI002FCA9DD7